MQTPTTFYFRNSNNVPLYPSSGSFYPALLEGQSIGCMASLVLKEITAYVEGLFVCSVF